MSPGSAAALGRKPVREPQPRASSAARANTSAATAERRIGLIVPRYGTARDLSRRAHERARPLWSRQGMNSAQFQQVLPMFPVNSVTCLPGAQAFICTETLVDDISRRLTEVSAQRPDRCLAISLCRPAGTTEKIVAS